MINWAFLEDDSSHSVAKHWWSVVYLQKVTTGVLTGNDGWRQAREVFGWEKRQDVGGGGLDMRADVQKASGFSHIPF